MKEKTKEATEKVAEPTTGAEHDMAEPCQRRHCTRSVFSDALVTIRVGNVDKDWCPDCVEEEFGMSYVDYQNNAVTHYLTAKTAWAFVIGASVTALLFLLFAI